MKSSSMVTMSLKALFIFIYWPSCGPENISIKVVIQFQHTAVEEFTKLQILPTLFDMFPKLEGTGVDMCTF